MAYTKIKPVKHHLQRCLDYTSNPKKTEKFSADDLNRLLSYTQNQNKTEHQLYVTGFRCNPATAYRRMYRTKKRWNQPMDEGDILAYHIIQSFSPGEATPDQVHKIGCEFARRFLADRFECTVSTHLDKGHLHNHIVVNSVSYADGKMFRNNFDTYYHGIRQVSDELCRENRLSVIETDGKGKSYDEWLSGQTGKPTIRGMVRKDVEQAIAAADSFNGFILELQNMGYTVKYGPRVEHMRLLVVLLAYAIFTLLEFCVLYSLLALLHIRYDEYVANMKLYLASAAITYSLKFLLSSGIKNIHKPMVASSASIKWAPLTIGFPLISLVGISICYYLSMNGKIAAAFVLFSSGILLATNAVILILIDLTEKNNLAQEQQKTLNEQLRSQRANIDALSSAYATQRKMTHDFRHHIAALSGMLQGGETQQAQDYLAALQEQQTERALMVNTHNSAIDAVLNQKGYAAQKQHIDIQFEVNDLSPLQIELIDCTVVLGNLLDNAIEACLKLEEAKRRIEVSVLRDEAYADSDAKLYVSIINTSLPVHIEKDCIATTKPEPHLHGFGLPCAKELLRRNNAFYTMDYHDGAFQFCFEWPDVTRNSCVHA